MNETQTNPPDFSPAADLAEQCRNLQRLVNVLFTGLILTSFTLTAFLGLQAHRTSVELELIKRRADQDAALLQQDNAASQAIYAKLAECARTHPDCQNKVLAKYKVSSSASSGKQ